MSGWRLEQSGEIDRSRPLSFSFDGREVTGFEGDTIASALLANGVSIVGRSFKYHRPRGIWGAGVEDPNAIVDIAGETFIPNIQATTQAAIEGLKVRSVNTSPTAAHDRNAFIDWFARFIPSAFYYKTFMFPSWHTYEPRIRAMAGLGRLDPESNEPLQADQLNETCDLLVIGAGPAGLAAAMHAAEAGLRVILCDDKPRPGGMLLHRHAQIDSLPATEWVGQAQARLVNAGGRLLTETTAFGYYDHGLVALSQKLGLGRAHRLWRVRAGHVILAAGALERNLYFANNDLPGIMSAEAGLTYLRRFGVAPGRNVVVASNNGQAYEAARALAAAGIKVSMVDYRPASGNTFTEGRLFNERRVVKAQGGSHLTAVLLDDGTRLEADALLVSGGHAPTVHLYCQAQGKLRWDGTILGFVPDRPVENLSIAGAANGDFTLSAALEGSSKALAGLGLDVSGFSKPENSDCDIRIVAAWPEPGMKGRIWLDLQNDVTTKDVELAARENFISVEHLKRYTTLGMATDQGKTSNVPGLALMASLTGRAIPDVGTTTYRPPFTPVPLATFAGLRSGILMDPPRRLPLEQKHRDAGAFFQEYGGWLRPAWYGEATPEEAIGREARQARQSVALFDATPLGKIEIIGPQAADFVDFLYYNTMSTLKPGRCRYGFILAESGIVYDDGVLVRLDKNRFIVSCSSSHVSGVYALMEEWRQDRFDRGKLFIHNATSQSATLTVSGPRSRALLEAVGLDLALDDDSLPHMATASCRLADIPARLTRVSFTGDRSYEISVSADKAPLMWEMVAEKGREFEAVLLGVEALMILRAEKGYLVIGKDTDGMTRPMDLGAHAPLKKKPVEFIGRRSLLQEEAARQDRKQLVGLEVLDNGGILPTGAHAIADSAQMPRSLGYVTSSYYSPNLERPIALGLVERGAERHGQTVQIRHLGQIRQARIVQPCAFDPSGDRLND